MSGPADPAALNEGGRDGGFTLLEMIILLVVLGLVAGIVVSHGPMRSRGVEVRTVVADVVRALRQARGSAIAADQPVLVVVNGTRRTLSVAGGPPLTMPVGLDLAAATGTDLVPTPKLAAIRFSPDGSSSGGRILLADGRRKVLVGVDWLTGRVSVANVP